MQRTTSSRVAGAAQQQPRRSPLPLASQRCRRSIASPATAAAAPSTSVQTGDGLVLSLGNTGAWDSGAVGNPVVRCYLAPPPLPSRGGADSASAASAAPVTRWVMWYSGRPSDADPLPRALAAACPAAGATGIAHSDDGVAWRRGEGDVAGKPGAAGRADAGRALAPNSDEWWWCDTCHATVSDVQVLGGAGGGGVYWMFYSGGDFEAVEAPRALLGGSGDAGEAATAEGLRMRVGLAMSQDGRNFARIEGDHHTGAVLDVGSGGGGSGSGASSSSSSWDSLYVSSPSVLVSGPSGDMRMYYTSFDARSGKFAVGVATSKDGLRWERLAGGAAPIFEGTGQAWDALGAASVQVVRDPDDPRGRYLMFYEAVGAEAGGTRSIGVVASADGLKGWAPLASGSEPLLSPATRGSGAWDAGGVGSPCAVPMSGGRWRLYYAGRGDDGDGAWSGIGLALGSLAEGPFKRRAGGPPAAPEASST